MTETTEKKEGIDIVMIGIYTGGAVVGIIFILVVIMCIQKCNKKKKALTEVVELRPKGVDKKSRQLERNSLKMLAYTKEKKP